MNVKELRQILNNVSDDTIIKTEIRYRGFGECMEDVEAYISDMNEGSEFEVYSKESEEEGFGKKVAILVIKKK